MSSAGFASSASMLWAQWLRRALAPMLGLLLAMPLLAAQAGAQQRSASEPAGAPAERERIAVERARIDADYAAAQQRCFQRFAVTDCRNESRRRRDAARTVLKKSEIELNDAERGRKAAVQRDNIEQRRLELEQREAEGAAVGRADAPIVERNPIVRTPRRTDAARGDEPKAPMAPRGKLREDRRERRATAAAGRADRIAQEAASVSQRERRLREAAEHQADVLERTEGRQKPAAPLPVPADAGITPP